MTRVSWATIIGGMVFLLTGFLFYHTFDEAYQLSILTAGKGPVFFPRFLLVLMFVLSAGVMWEGRKEKFAPATMRQSFFVLGTLGLTGVYIYSITAAGFLLSTIVFVFSLPWLLNYRNLVVISVMTAVYPVTAWYVFEKLFMIILPSSPWFDAF